MNEYYLFKIQIIGLHAARKILAKLVNVKNQHGTVYLLAHPSQIQLINI